MKQLPVRIIAILLITVTTVSLTACNFFDTKLNDIRKNDIEDSSQTLQASNANKQNSTSKKLKEAKKTGNTTKKQNKNAIQVVANPESTIVLVNKQYRLPDQYEPQDLVYPDVRFIFSEKVEKRMMRKEAAKALEKMFASAEKDGINLAGVSGYRSKATQVNLYNNYVQKDGKEAADRYSARPGHSEHQTGLTMDVSGATGNCAATACFKDTPEAKWLAEHAHEFGFIIRYPEGKEEITGYLYEPWHIRYVGVEIAKEIYEKDITLEEYIGGAVPVIGEEE